MPTGMTKIKGPKASDIGRIWSQPVSKEYRDNYDEVFRKKKEDNDESVEKDES